MSNLKYLTLEQLRVERAVRKKQVLVPSMTPVQKAAWLFGYKMPFKVLEKFTVGQVCD